MGLFKLFKPKSPALPQQQNAAVPEASKTIPPTPATNGTDLQAIYLYAKTDFEARGYQDALTNPDTAYKNENISLLLEDLDIQIKQAQNYYAARLIKLDFHIASRKAAGLIDTGEGAGKSKNHYCTTTNRGPTNHQRQNRGPGTGKTHYPFLQPRV